MALRGSISQIFLGINTDLCSETNNLTNFYIVYSLGFVEHFSDTDLVIEEHLSLLKENGLSPTGMPKFKGINKLFLKILALNLLSKHIIEMMHIRNCKSFEQKFNLKTVFKGYVGDLSHPFSISGKRKQLSLLYLML